MACNIGHIERDSGKEIVSITFPESFQEMYSFCNTFCLPCFLFAFAKLVSTPVNFIPELTSTTTASEALLKFLRPAQLQ